MNQKAATETHSFFWIASGASCQSCLFLLLECYSETENPAFLPRILTSD
ncbi:hypothetical protein BH18ACI2_BH18ACI2_08660 [soil metagenome]